MTYRILFIGTRHQLRQMGAKHEVIRQDLRTPTWYQPDPGKKAIYGVPPWDNRFLWEIDAPFPVGANPPLGNVDIETFVPDADTMMAWRDVFAPNFDWKNYIWLRWADQSTDEEKIEKLRDFFRREFPNQLD